MSVKTNLVVDTLALGGFLVALEPRLTGVAVHEWLSLALAGTLLVHLALHWEWVIQVATRFVRKLWHSSRLNFIVDALLFLAMILVTLSGILISRSVLPTLGLQLTASQSWRFLHSTAANACLALTGLHFALHWKWVFSNISRFVVQPVARLFTSRKLQPAPIPVVVVEEERR